jgi:acyl carrier protein
MDELYEKMKNIITEKLDVNVGKITMKASFRDDLGADDLDIYELVYEIENQMGISIPDEKVNEFETVKDVYDFIKAQKGGGKASNEQGTSSVASNNSGYSSCTSIFTAAEKGTVEEDIKNCTSLQGRWKSLLRDEYTFTGKKLPY